MGRHSNRAGPDSLVSVIVPAWNAERTLLETVRSAAAQTHRNLEILIVDDGSTDRTAEIAGEFCATDDRARLIRTQNHGVAAARNRAIDEARGEWIAPLDADDLWHPEKIERQLRTFANGSRRVGMVYCWFRIIDEQGRLCEPAWAPVVEGSVFDQHLQCNFSTASAPLFRRSALGNLRYNLELRSCEDWLLQLQIAAAHEIACAPAFLLGYRTGPNNMSSNKVRMIDAHIQMYEIIRREFPLRERRVVRRELARWHALRALKQATADPFTKTCSELLSALTKAPLLTAKVALFYRRYRDLHRLAPTNSNKFSGPPFLSAAECERAASFDPLIKR
jgi:glycosyltransferase involved in cell wall biosynthesis